MTKAEMLDRISSRELTEQREFYNLEPFGDEWRQVGTLAALLYNANRASNAQALAPDDFMPRMVAEADTMVNDNEMLAKCHQLAAIFGGPTE